MSNEQKPAASTLERRIYWTTRDQLEQTIADQRAKWACTTDQRHTPQWVLDIGILRERLTALGEPPGPRVREGDAGNERRDRFIAAALTGLLANPNCDLPADSVALRAADYADALATTADSEKP
jgi:hypothetical protein